MFNPYFLMAILYLSLAVLGALDAALVSFDLLPAFAGLRWIRVHFITLGALTEFVFGIMPLLVAAHNNVPRPKLRWDIWLTFNLGLLILLVGIPLVNAALITAGGTLIFIAAILLMLQLSAMRGGSSQSTASEGRKFYIAGLAYLLLGILVGTGLWQGWGAWLQIKVPIEVHIHANNWGFMSLVFAGLLIDLYPSVTGRSLGWAGSVTPIFWGMTLGALGLVLGPWFQSNWFSVPGLIVHLSATIWLLANIIKPLIGKRELWTVGMLHLVTAYAWILAPVLVAPLIILQVPGFPGADIEQSAPQALIYGWVLQFGYAMIPLLFRRAFQSDTPNQLGGNWFSLLAVHLGGIFLWIGIFRHDSQGLLHGIAYSLWFVSMLPIVFELWHIVSEGLSRLVDTDKVVLVTDVES
jgi:cytochrome c oxidase cbb3-type subunit 1